MNLVIRLDSPLAPDVGIVLQRHLDMVWAASPPESVHAFDPADLAGPGVQFYTLREEGSVLGTGAFVRIEDGHAELKSMHVVAEARGRGLAATLLRHLLDEARATGYARMSLETGSGEVFAPARALYAKAGFRECGPFEGYAFDPESYFMTVML